MIEFSLGKACPCCVQILWGAGNTKPKNDPVVLALKIVIYGAHERQQWQRGAAARAREAKSKGSPRGSNLESHQGWWSGAERPPKHEGRGGVLNPPKASLDGYKARKTVWHSNETLDASLPLHRRQGTHEVWLLLG